MGRVPGNMQNAQECREACIQLEGCVGFSFVKAETVQDNCAVKSSWVPSTRNPNNGVDSQRVTDECRNSNQGIFFYSKDPYIHISYLVGIFR